MKPYDFKWTKLYDPDIAFEALYPGMDIGITEGELVICATVIDPDSFSILTTRKLITREQGVLHSGLIAGAMEIADENGMHYGNFKGSKDLAFTFGHLRLADGRGMKYFIETGKAAMVMIHAVRTIIRTQAMTAVRIDKVTAIWSRKTDGRQI